jgi:phospholipid/cholesterol/gamma-HCH transport system permease protein
MSSIGVGSFGIVSLISVFTGAVSTIQIGVQLVSGLVPDYMLGTFVRDSNIYEFSPTITCLVLAGKVGSSIASEMGTMKVTEQIDALEVMGVNSLNYLVFPKIIALLLYPFLIGLSMFLGVFGGWMAAVYGGFTSSSEFITGLQSEFIPFHIAYAFIKTFTFALILATIPSFHGYYMKGGALEVGQASTVSFVWTSVVIILMNFILTQLLLS